MITLTIPSIVSSVLGGEVPVEYDRLILNKINFDTIRKDISANLELTSTTEPEMQMISGNLRVIFDASELTIQIPQLRFLRQITLTAPQKTGLELIVTDAQDALEDGIILLNLVDGTQSTGT